MADLVGTVGSVDDVPAGSVVLDDHTLGETVLRVVDAADFAEDGGTVEVGGDVVTYTAADLTSDVLTLAAPLPAAVESDTPARVHPYAPTRVAVVEVEGAAEPLQAVVPQSLLDQMPAGLREVDVAETVTLGLDDGRWVVRDLVGVPSRAMDTESVREIVIGTATGKTRHSVRYVTEPLPAPPSVDDRGEGDTHWDMWDGSGIVARTFAFVGGQWELTKLADAVLDSVAAGKILAGTVNVALDLDVSGSIQVGSDTQGYTRVEGGPAGGVRYYLPGVAEPITELGKTFAARSAAGAVTASMDGETGTMTAETGKFASLLVGGVDVMQQIGESAKIVVDDSPAPYSRGPYTTETGYREIGFVATPGHAYRIEVAVNVVNSSTGLGAFFAYVRQTSSTTGGAPAPTISSPSPASDSGQVSSGTEGRFHMAYLHSNTASEPENVRVMVTARGGGDRSFRFERASFIVTDMGLYNPPVTSGRWTLGGASGTTPDPTPPPQPYSKWYDFDWSCVYQHAGKHTDPTLGTKLRTGRVGGNASYPSASLLRIPDAMRTALMEAAKIKVYLQLTNIGWQDGPVVVGQATTSTSSPPSSFPTPIGLVNLGSISRGATELFLLPSDWVSRWADGTNRSLTLGRLDSAGFNDRMLEFRGLGGAASVRARLYAEWEK